MVNCVIDGISEASTEGTLFRGRQVIQTDSEYHKTSNCIIA